MADRTAYHCFTRLETLGYVQLTGTHYRSVHREDA
jgi:hypothetical protein